MLSLLFIVLAALGLGVLIFVHELGHYWMARRVGIKVEAFSIGFGRPIVKWVRQGVEWRVGWLPLGGYVRMAGESKNGDVPPHEVEGGFFAARPIDRIKVALAGPVVNFAFALMLFAAIWMGGGREKPFQEFTHRIGWVDPNSELYEAGIRPGDIIDSYDQHVPNVRRDHLTAPLLADETLRVQGYRVDYPKGEKRPFDLRVPIYPHPAGIDDGFMTVGILQPAEYLLFEDLLEGVDAIEQGSPLLGSRLQAGDRLLWLDGQLLYSREQLIHLLSEARALLTVQRGDETFLRRVPRIPLGELALADPVRYELGDWHYEAGLSERFLETTFIPYDLSSEGEVTGRLGPIDQEHEGDLFPKHPYSTVDEPLQVGDHIVAVDGVPIEKMTQLLELLQKHRVHLMVQRGVTPDPSIPSSKADAEFDADVNWNDYQALIAQIGRRQPAQSEGELQLLRPFLPVTLKAIAEKAPPESQLGRRFARRIKAIESISDPAQRAQELRELEGQLDTPMLGVRVQDRQVRYNPQPLTTFWNVIVDTWRTLKALVVGALSPKWLSGPVGIVTVIQYGWAVGVKEAAFWLGVISLNLGILNLLPIPVLDGGNICFSLWELVSRRRLRPEVMEKLIIPFVVVIIGFFLFVTYHDLSRLFRGLF